MDIRPPPRHLPPHPPPRGEGVQRWHAQLWERLHAAFGLPTDDPVLAISQLAALSRQMPLLYATLLSNALFLVATHYAVAPWPVTVVVSALLVVGCMVRLVVWAKRRGRAVDGREAIRQLRQTALVALVLGTVFALWSLALYPYGDAYAQCHVEFFMAVTVICCIFSLVHLRAAALGLTMVVGVPFLLFFLRSPHYEVVVMAVNMLIVTVGMILMLLRSHDDFTALIRSGRELARRQRETQRLSDDNLRLAYQDTLSGLPNRRCFFAMLDDALQRARTQHRRVAVAVLDIDRFKSVNDVHGHAAGDRLLTQLGMRLKRLVGPNVFIARLNGDEFGAILENIPDDAQAREFGDDVKQLMVAPYVVGDRLARLSCSLGVAVYPQAGTSAEELFERADYALQYGKQVRRGELVIFTAEHETSIREVAKLEHIFRAADLEAEMYLAFQPIVDVVERRVIAFEALARWRSRELGPVSPAVFIPVAERIQMIGRLTTVLLAKALLAATHWPAAIGLNFNLSGYDLASPETMTSVCRLVRASGLEPGRIAFEVTETGVLRDFDEAAAALQSLRDLGACIALDDFGTGYSSLGYVHRLHLDKIKIDRSFVTGVEIGGSGQAIIRTVLTLCQNLDVACVVEGVETEDQARAVAALGCRYIQGYFWSQPVGGEHVILLAEQIAVRGISVLPTGLEAVAI